MAAGAALAAKRGQTSKASLKGASKKMVNSMSTKQLSEVASTKRKKLPVKKGAAAKSSGAKPKAAAKKAASKKAPAKKAAAKKTAARKR